MGQRKGMVAIKDFVPARFIDLYESPKKAHREVSKQLALLGTATVEELRNATGQTKYSVLMAVKNFRDWNMIHAVGWDFIPPATYVARYGLGGGEDAPKVLKRGKSSLTVKEKTAIAEAAPKPEEIEVTVKYGHCEELAKALVPTRNEKEQYEINRLYLNWISGGMYD